MGNDMVAATKLASANQTTLFALNHHAPSSVQASLVLRPGQTHEPGEYSMLRQLRLPEGRHAATVLALQAAERWGYEYGVNEHRVTLGYTSWETRFPNQTTTFHGSDLVRLMLERGQSAHAAIETAIDLLSRYGERESSEGNIFLVADPQESFLLETCGRHWALLECGQTRVVTDAAMIRQDWSRLAPGLASDLIEKGQWEDDGSKLDFARCLGGTQGNRTLRAQRRWGRASLAMAQQHGAIDLHFLRRMLADHYTANRNLLQPAKETRLASTFLVDLQSKDTPLLAWHAFGKPKVALYFPICLVGELPDAFRADADESIQKCTAELRRQARGSEGIKVVHAMERLQAKFDQDADDFLIRTHTRRHGDNYPIVSCATEMMDHHVAMFRSECDHLVGVPARKTRFVPVEEEEVLYFA